MARVCDTRIHYEKGNNYFLRQSQTKQESFNNLAHMDPHQFSDINGLAQFLPVTKETTEKIVIQWSLVWEVQHNAAAAATGPIYIL